MSEQRTNNKVQLGCWTLVIIAVIVMIFSGDRNSDELQELDRKVDRLERKIDELSRKLDREAMPSSAGFWVGSEARSSVEEEALTVSLSLRNDAQAFGSHSLCVDVNGRAVVYEFAQKRGILPAVRRRVVPGEPLVIAGWNGAQAELPCGIGGGGSKQIRAISQVGSGNQRDYRIG